MCEYESVKKCYQEDRKRHFYHIFTKQCVIRGLISKYARINLPNISTCPNLFLLRVQLDSYCIYIFKTFLLTCLRVEKVIAETWSTHMTVTLCIKFMFCQTVQLQFIITWTVCQQFHSFFQNEVWKTASFFFPFSESHRRPVYFSFLVISSLYLSCNKVFQKANPTHNVTNSVIFAIFYCLQYISLLVGFVQSFIFCTIHPFF